MTEGQREVSNTCSINSSISFPRRIIGQEGGASPSLGGLGGRNISPGVPVRQVSGRAVGLSGCTGPSGIWRSPSLGGGDDHCY